MSERDKEDSFATFKGLGYVSMVRGVPLGPLLILFMLGVLGGMGLAFIIGWFALIWAFFCAGCILFLKVLCETDNKAMERAQWSFRAWKLRLSKVSTVLTVSPNKLGTKNEHFFERLKKIHRTG